MQAANWLGWLSSAILVVTLGHQVLKQWREGSSEGVSIWLFVGQMAASVGFLIYSVLLKNWVFTVTNALLVLNGLAGYMITLHNKRRSGRPVEATPAHDPLAAASTSDAE